METEKKRIGFIGLGNMGTAIYRALGEKFGKLAYDPNPRDEEGLEYVGSLAELTSQSDILVLAVKPAQVEAVLKSLSKPTTIISIAAGIVWKDLANWAPIGSQVVRTMPNLPLLVKQGVVGYYGDSNVDAIVEEIFSPMGKTIRLEKEELLDAITGLSGSGPAFVFSFVQALAEGGVQSGLSYSDSLDIALQTVRGSIEYMNALRCENPGLHPSELRNRVTSPGGTTIYGLAEWEKNSVHSGVMEAVYAATKRARELGS